MYDKVNRKSSAVKLIFRLKLFYKEYVNFHAKALLDVLHNFEKVENVSLKNFNKSILTA